MPLSLTKIDQGKNYYYKINTAHKTAKTKKNLRKVHHSVSIVSINMHLFCYPVNDQHDEGKDHRHLLTLTPVITVPIQICIFGIDQSAALK